MINSIKKFKKVVILDTVIFYPEHRALLESMSEEVVEFPSSLPENLEKQYEDTPELFRNKKCYTQIATDNIPLQLLANRVDGAEVIISCWTNIPDEILRLNPQLKLIIFWTHEKEHRINVALAKELGITISNIPDYGTDAVAEVVFAGLWRLIERNYGESVPPASSNARIHAVMGRVFDYYRQLGNNEKYTRAGKFSHHFHKLGLVNFDFSRKNLDELIPERLIAHKRIGLLHVEQAKEVARTLEVFGVHVDICTETDMSLAAYYKFLSENELVFFDSARVSAEEVVKNRLLFGDKMIDVQTLTGSHYSFDQKVFGVVGLGRIGVKVARLARSLGFEVVYCSKQRNADLEKEIGVKYVSLEDLVSTADVISIHLSAHKAENLITRELINAMKPGTIFVNTADGNAVDQVALTDRMVRGEIVAYLDVYPGLPRKDVLGLSMEDKSDWKLHTVLANNVLAYRAGWKTQESIGVKTYKLLGAMTDFLVGQESV